jgi:hypothetical protein
MLWILSIREAHHAEIASAQKFRLLISDQAEALTRDLLQSVRIENFNMSVTVLDQTSLLQRAGGHGYSRPPDRQHHREEFLCERHLIRGDPVARQQQPSGAALLDAVSGIARCSLRDLLVINFGVSGEAARVLRDSA